MSGLSLRKKSTNKLSKDPSGSVPPEPIPAVITEEAMLSPVTENESTSPPKSQRNKKTPREERKRGGKSKVVDADADGKSSHGGAKPIKANNATNLRFEKIEKYLHDRFDWLGVLKQERD